ncbi:hypothetical protein DLJ53_02015 [Acuticoccus sediminis]|uniref:TNase-like domain-containing protein n=3 Tax=Acuticoccus sediminis TaxID=2184697 RepID=A0A8B2NSW8_9HYPH|nr:hypothetical protein DLJ53_02015 [Acuticoccus sediminis]
MCGGFWLFAMESLEDLPGRASIREATSAAADSADRRGEDGPIVVAPRVTVPDAPVDRSTAPAAPTAEAAARNAGGGVRYVEGAGIAAPRPTGPLVREERPDVMPPQAKRGPGPERFKLVVIESAGVVDARTHKITLPYVDAPSADATCQSASGGTWPCGARARTAMRRLVQRRALDCVPLDRNSDEPVRAADCEVAGINLSQWLIEQGWAAPTPEAPEAYVALHKAAVEAQRGLYRADGR